MVANEENVSHVITCCKDSWCLPLCIIVQSPNSILLLWALCTTWIRYVWLFWVDMIQNSFIDKSECHSIYALSWVSWLSHHKALPQCLAHQKSQPWNLKDHFSKINKDCNRRRQILTIIFHWIFWDISVSIAKWAVLLQCFVSDQISSGTLFSGIVFKWSLDIRMLQ